jgi:hypothetical protein
VIGGGTGSFIVVLSDWLGLSGKTALLIQSAAPVVAVAVAHVGPSVSRLAKNIASLIGLSFVVKRERLRLKDIPEGSPARQRIEQTIEETHGLISDLVQDILSVFRKRE